MKYMTILKTTTIYGGSQTTVVNWIREVGEFTSHKKARSLATIFANEQPTVKIETPNQEYPVQFVKWDIINEKHYNRIKNGDSLNGY